MMPVKMATPGLLKVNVFWNKGHDVINSVHDIIKSPPSCDTNFIVALVMWSDVCDASVSKREAIVISVL